MSRVYFRAELETVATYWRIDRPDGVSLGFTSHDRALHLDGLDLEPAPGMLPAAISRSASLQPDSAEVEAALTHGAITAPDLDAGRFDGARIAIGIIDWVTGEHAELYCGSIGQTERDGERFTAELLSAKHDLAADIVPRTSPTCRAAFCGRECGLSSARFTREAIVAAVDETGDAVTFEGVADSAAYSGGRLRWVDGQHTGLWTAIVSVDGAQIGIEDWPDPPPIPGERAILQEGCDHTLETCTTRFTNAANFRGEPFLPGNDQLVRRPAPSA